MTPTPNPNWTHFVRFATPAEIARLQAEGLDLSCVAPDHYIYALHRLGDEVVQFTTLPLQGDLDADACRDLWYRYIGVRQ